MARARQECRVVAQQSHDAYLRAIDAGTEVEAAIKYSVWTELAWAVSFAVRNPLPLELVGTRALNAAVQGRTGAVESVIVPSAALAAATAAQNPVMRGVVWEVVGNPFRAAHFSREWRTDTAVSLARQMYDAREFSAMPILADALQDAGCDDEELLAHCRSDVAHVRGCWAVDLVLGLL